MTNIEKVPPHNIEAEEAVLGSILFDPSTLDRLSDIICPEDFYISSHASIYRAAIQLHRLGQPTDLIAVADWLAAYRLLESIGGRAKLAQLVDCVVSSASAEYAAALVGDKSLARRLIAAGNEIIDLGSNEVLEVTERLDQAEQKLFNLRKDRSSNGIQPISDVAVDVFAYLGQIDSTGELPALATGFYDLDEMLAGGLYPGDLIVLGGRPSMGKSLLGCTLAYRIAEIYKQHTLIFSLEMPKQSIVMRFLANLAELDSQKIRQAKLSSAQWDKLTEAMNSLNQVPVLVDDSACPSIAEIRSKVRQSATQHGDLKLIVIDYLQLMIDGSASNLTQRIGEVTRQLKLLAKECNVPIVLLSQLNRGVEDRNNKRPLQSDLRDSGRIEEDADVILFCYRDEYYNPETVDRGVMEVICTKHRNGETGTVKLLFEGAYSRLRNLTRGRLNS